MNAVALIPEPAIPYVVVALVLGVAIGVLVTLLVARASALR